MRNGVQYASTETKRVPMYDDVAADRVIANIAAMYPTTPRPCDCGREARTIEAAKNGADVDAIVAAYACLESCATKSSPIPFDARALVEEKCGRFVRGSHAGRLRGWAEIERVRIGGWKKYGPGEGNGRVVYPGTILSIRITTFDGKTLLEVAR